MESNTAMAALKNCHMFSTLDDADLDTMTFLADRKEFADGETIYRKGEPSNDKFCMIVTGSVNIIAKNGRVVKSLGPNEVIGEIALSDPNRQRTVTVVTKEATNVMEWDVNYVKSKMPDIWKKLVKLAWEHISNFYEE